jgi:hypothetical protein
MKKLKFILFLIVLSNICVAQDIVPVSKIDTLIPFFGNEPLRLAGYENRVVPFDSPLPLYVSITYGESKKINFEYFRVDSGSYLVYEYFRNNKVSSNDGIKSQGMKRVENNIIDSSATSLIHVGRDTRITKEIHYFKEFSKEGEWEEYENSSFYNICWRGNYRNNKRIGLWKRVMYGVGDDLILEERNYDVDSTKKIYTSNRAGNISLDSLQSMLIGRWTLQSCDEEKTHRMSYSKCPTYDGHYGDDCKDNYYDFISPTNFARQRGDGCYKFRESCIKGKWKIIEKDGQRFLKIKYTNGLTWKLKILYIDNESNLITDRQ